MKSSLTGALWVSRRRQYRLSRKKLQCSAAYRTHTVSVSQYDHNYVFVRSELMCTMSLQTTVSIQLSFMIHDILLQVWFDLSIYTIIEHNQQMLYQLLNHYPRLCLKLHRCETERVLCHKCLAMGHHQFC